MSEARKQIHLSVGLPLLARAEQAAEAEGLTRTEYMRKAIVAACERTEQLQARRERTAKGRAR